MKSTIIAAVLSSTAYTRTLFCTEKGISWFRFNGKAQNIAASSTSGAVWVISNYRHPTGGYKLAQLDFRRKSMLLESRASRGAKPWVGSPIAVDFQGNPAYIDAEKRLHWR